MTTIAFTTTEITATMVMTTVCSTHPPLSTHTNIYLAAGGVQGERIHVGGVDGAVDHRQFAIDLASVRYHQTIDKGSL